MEIIGSLIGLALLFGLIKFIFGLIGAGAKAVHTAVTGKTTYFGEPQLKIDDETLDETGWTIKKIMFRGALPNDQPMRLSFATSLLDITDGLDDLRPVISIADAAQERETICYQTNGEFGQVNPGTAVTDWIQLGVIIPELLQTSRAGTRKLLAVVRVFDTANAPVISGGVAEQDRGTILTKTISFSYEFNDTGYEEVSEQRKEAQAISLKIAVAVAMADGKLDDSEGEVIKSWIKKELGAFTGEEYENRKNTFNNAFKEAHGLASTSDLALSDLVDRLAEINDKKAKYDAVELCLDVMAADGVADPEEMRVIRKVAEALELDANEIENMRQAVTLNLSAELTTQAGLEALVGIEADWPDEQKRKHLRAEYQKWSNRINSLSEGDEKNNAQSMLNNIAELRKKYG